MQRTLNSPVTCTGTSLHSGDEITLTIRPARADNGIRFIRTDIQDQDNMIPALWNYVVDTRLCTVIGNDAGVIVGTIEHLMSALRGCGVDNAVIEVSGSEVPVMDGSAMPFVNMIEEVGLQEQSLPRRAIKILKEVSVLDGDKTISLRPSDECIFGGEIDFDHPEIGTQSFETKLVNGNFKHDIADARTFGFLHEVEYMRSQGLALGGSLDNAIILDKETIMNEEGLRHEDEFIRHKLLDAIGDMYLAGGHILGAYDGLKAGHAMNNAILRELFADDSAWEYVYLDDDGVEKRASSPSISFTQNEDNFVSV